MTRDGHLVKDGSQTRTRPASPDDAKILWHWANDPTTRSTSFQPEPFDFEHHLAWYREKLASPDCRIWIAYDERDALGQVRYDRIGDEAEVSVSVARDVRGRGIGRELLRDTAALACRALHVSTLVALVRDDNMASLRAFAGAGYAVSGVETRNGLRVVRLGRTHELF